MSFAALQPGARSPNRSFENGPGAPHGVGPAPEGVHAHAACLAAPLMAVGRFSRELECTLAEPNTEGRQGGMILKSLRKNNPLFFIVEVPVPYAGLLRVMSLHRIVWQLDGDEGPGASASAALLCRIPCMGGNGAVGRIAFPGISSLASREDLFESARLLLTNDKAWQEDVEASQHRAAEFLSFHKTALRLQSPRA